MPTTPATSTVTFPVDNSKTGTVPVAYINYLESRANGTGGFVHMFSGSVVEINDATAWTALGTAFAAHHTNLMAMIAHKVDV